MRQNNAPQGNRTIALLVALGLIMLPPLWAANRVAAQDDGDCGSSNYMMAEEGGSCEEFETEADGDEGEYDEASCRGICEKVFGVAFDRGQERCFYYACQDYSRMGHRYIICRYKCYFIYADN